LRSAVRLFWLVDRGAVAVEFALLFPAQLLMFAGTFGVGAVMIESTQLNYVVQGAARVEAANPGTGVAWASTQLAPPAAFVANPTAPCGAQIAGQWPVSLGVFPTLTLSAQACWPK
jgi:Flp pilus assembly protein TadG